MNTKEASKFFNRLYKTIWQDGKLELFPTFYNPDVNMEIGEKCIDYNQIYERALQQKNSGSQMEYEIHALIAESERVAIHIDVRNLVGKNLSIMAFFKFKEGKIYHAKTMSSYL